MQLKYKRRFDIGVSCENSFIRMRLAVLILVKSSRIFCFGIIRIHWDHYPRNRFSNRVSFNFRSTDSNKTLYKVAVIQEVKTFGYESNESLLMTMWKVNTRVAWWKAKLKKFANWCVKWHRRVIMGSIMNRTIVVINVEVAKDSIFMPESRIRLTRYFIWRWSSSAGRVLFTKIICEWILLELNKIMVCCFFKVFFASIYPFLDSQFSFSPIDYK